MGIVCFLFSFTITVTIPLILMTWITVKKKDYRKSFWIGFACFFFFQLMTRLPILSLLSTNQAFISFIENHFLLYSLLLGLSAALFEEIGRFICMELFMKENKTTKDAYIFGIGHWACEALFLVGTNYLFMLLYTGFTDLPPAIIWGGLERLFVLPIHIAASVMVMHFVRKKDVRFFLLALFMHTVIDTAIIPLQTFAQNPIMVEGYVFVSGLLCCYFLFIYNKFFNKERNES